MALPAAFHAPSPHQSARRRLPIGAEIIDAHTTHFRLWAPAAHRVDLVFTDGRRVALAHEDNGYFSGLAASGVGDRYQYQLDDADLLYPDPASRAQPEGPHGPSQIVDPHAFIWTDADWRGRSLDGQVIYELHTGTFTKDGTWAAAARELPELARLGVTVVEMMPVAEFDGAFGWGYDGVDLFAPSHLYGTPDDLRRFVDDAHRVGLAVILDVVYNHFGPVGNYLRAFSPDYFTDRYGNEWGEAINFDGPQSGPVREFFLANAAYWIEEYHFDGLRLDATQQIFDASPTHIVAEIGQAVRAGARGRATIVVAENESQQAALVRPIAEDGRGLDGVWNDDFHHSAMVALTGRAEAYYHDTRGEPQELVSAAKYGYLFQGQYYHWQRQRRGTPALDLPPWAFVTFLQNHDQVANSARGLRGHQLSSPGKWRAMTAMMLLMPGTPMLFQGQEFCASTPFLYFADFDSELMHGVRHGRAEFLTQFPSVRGYLAQNELDDPASRDTFERCKLDLSERERHLPMYQMHQHLIDLRRRTRAFQPQPQRTVDGAVLSTHAFALRFFGGEPADDRLLVVNLGPALHRTSFAEPLLAPPADRDWCIEWSSEEPAYGGHGTPDVWPHGQWAMPAECALVCAPCPKADRPVEPVQRRTA